MGLTQEDVAIRLCVSRQTVGKWESGKAVPELEKLVALCDLLECSLDELVGRVDAKAHCEYVNRGSSVIGDLESAASAEADPSADSNDEVWVLRGRRSTMRAGVLATGVCLLLAAVGPLILLIGPWPVENFEVRCVALVAAVFVACLGIVFVATSMKADVNLVEARITNLVASRKWRVAILVLSMAVVALAAAFFIVAPITRTTVFAFVELVALASWPIAAVIALSRDGRE